jgi:hypothetical protein
MKLVGAPVAFVLNDIVRVNRKVTNKYTIAETGRVIEVELGGVFVYLKADWRVQFGWFKNNELELVR